MKRRNNASEIVRGSFIQALAPLVVLAGVMGCGASVDAALVHQWTFEEADGMGPPQVLNSVSSNHGTFLNMDDSNRSTDVPPTGSTRSLNFNSGATNNERVNLASEIFLNDTTNFSVAIWYRGTETQTGGGLPGPSLFGTSNGDYFATLGILGGKATYWHYVNGGPGWTPVSSLTTINNDAWHHIAVVNHANQTADLYVDGVAEVTGFSSQAGAVGNDIYGFLIGEFMHLGNPNLHTKGKIDDAYVFTHALSPFDVKVLAGTAVPEPASFTLVLLGLVGIGIRRRRRSR